MFCPKCGSILTVRTVGKKRILGCSCGYTQKKKEKFSIRESVEKGKEIEIIEKEIETLPITKEECSKCKNREAYYWTIQTRAGDEPETKFLKCTKCKHTWRDYN